MIGRLRQPINDVINSNNNDNAALHPSSSSSSSQSLSQAPIDYLKSFVINTTHHPHSLPGSDAQQPPQQQEQPPQHQARHNPLAGISSTLPLPRSPSQIAQSNPPRPSQRSQSNPPRSPASVVAGVVASMHVAAATGGGPALGQGLGPGQGREDDDDDGYYLMSHQGGGQGLDRGETAGGRRGGGGERGGGSENDNDNTHQQQYHHHQQQQQYDHIGEAVARAAEADNDTAELLHFDAIYGGGGGGGGGGEGRGQASNHQVRKTLSHAHTFVPSRHPFSPPILPRLTPYLSPLT